MPVPRALLVMTALGIPRSKLTVPPGTFVQEELYPLPVVERGPTVLWDQSSRWWFPLVIILLEVMPITEQMRRNAMLELSALVVFKLHARMVQLQQLGPLTVIPVPPAKRASTKFMDVQQKKIHFASNDHLGIFNIDGIGRVV